MATRKRNEYLDDDDSDDDQGYRSDEEEESRGAIADRASKRRKVEALLEAEIFRVWSPEQDHTAVGIAQDDGRTDGRNLEPAKTLEDTGFTNEDDDVSGQGSSSILDTTSRTRALKQNLAAQKASHKSGVIYISRVPPFMKPQTLKHFLSPHAQKGLGRVFLTPEDHVAHSRRVKSGGNKKKSFTDGWVEFVSKREAKIAAQTLNGDIIGGKKGNFYHDDLWNIKYLKGFKWSHLTEQIAAENAERAARLREEIRRTRKENKAFLDDVERGKMLAGMESKKMVKLKDEVPLGQATRRGREFKQRKVRTTDDQSTATAEQSAQVHRALTKIF